MKTLLKGYLSFTRKERIGIIVLLVIIIICTALPLCFPLLSSKQKVALSVQDKMTALPLQKTDSSRFVASGQRGSGDYYRQQWNNNDKRTVGELFYFDPNKATPDDWKRLGVRDKTIATIQNYLSKGGHFYQPSDIGKIWGLHQDEVERLLPYVRIAGNNRYEKRYAQPDYPKRENSDSKPTRAININDADTTAFIDLPGIGSKLAGRIVAFRNKLGGFYSVEQLAETYGLPDSTFLKIKNRLAVGETSVKQLNINQLSVDELKQHPYIRYPLANAIVQYRVQHGLFAKVEDIKLIMLVTEDVYTKIAPYLTIK